MHVFVRACVCVRVLDLLPPSLLVCAARGDEEWGEESVGREAAADNTALREEAGDLPESEGWREGRERRERKQGEEERVELTQSHL